jgi:hypothetical protein
MAGWGVFLALTGFHSDMVDRLISFTPPVGGADFRTFWCTDRAWGTYRHQINDITGQVDATIDVLHGDLVGIEVRSPAGDLVGIPVPSTQGTSDVR